MVLGNIRSAWGLPLLIVLFGKAKAQVGVSICACQPSVYTFQFNFSAFCDVGTVDYRDGIIGADCFVRGVGLGSENTVDKRPVQISKVSILELDKKNQVLAHTPYTGDFRDGDEITYTSVAATTQGLQRLNPDLMPGGLQLDMVGINELEEPITNVWIILFENDCGLFPVLEVGDQVGWSIISDLKTPRSEVCPIGATEGPTFSPTFFPTNPFQSPSIGPKSPTLAPSIITDDREGVPTMAPINSTVPVCIRGKGKSGGKSGKSGSSWGKSGKSGSSSGKSGKAGDRSLQEFYVYEFGGKGHHEGQGKGHGKGSGKGYRDDDECLPEKKSKPKMESSHKKIEKEGKGGKASGKAGKGGKAGGKAAKKNQVDSKANIPKLGGKTKSGKSMSGKSKSSVFKAITFGKGAMTHKESIAHDTFSVSYAPSRLPKKTAPPVTSKVAKLAKAPAPIELRVGNVKPRSRAPPPTLQPVRQPSPPPTTPEPTTYFATVNTQYMQSRMNHWLHEQNPNNEETENRMIRQ